MEQSVRRQLLVIGGLILSSAPGLIYFLRLDFGAAEFCMQQGAMIQCMSIFRQAAEFMLRYPLLFGLATLDMIGGTSVAVYKMTRLFRPKKMLTMDPD